MFNKVLRFGLAVVLLGLAALAAVGCSQDNASPTGLSEPFTVDMGYFTLEGYSSGYEPGNKYSFKVSLNNTEKEEWKSHFSAYLIDTDGVVMDIVSRRPINLPPLAAISSRFEMDLPENVTDGMYGLMMVFPGRGSSITTIYVGEEPAPTGMPARPGQDPPATQGPWPDPEDLPQL